MKMLGMYRQEGVKMLEPSVTLAIHGRHHLKTAGRSFPQTNVRFCLKRTHCILNYCAQRNAIQLREILYSKN